MIEVLIGVAGLVAGTIFSFAVFVGIEHAPALFGYKPLRDGGYWEGTRWEDATRAGRRRFELASAVFVIVAGLLLVLFVIVLLVRLAAT